MNQKNNNEENILDIDKLLKIVMNLHDYREERISMKKILSKAPSRTIRERYSKAKLEYLNALAEFDLFIKDYIKVNPEILIDDIRKMIQDELKKEKN